MNEKKAGDFTGLAEDYSNSRPNYSEAILNGLLGLLDMARNEIDFCDIGAGTGIWTRMVYEKGLQSVHAIEPNMDMLKQGIGDSDKRKIVWINGSAENTTLQNESMDWVSMASSFHWVDFEKSVIEFHRILRSDGQFTALWNPRLIEVNPLLVEIEEHLDVLRPNIKRVSSGRSGITECLTEKLEESHYFHNVIYLEGKHVISMSPQRYLSAWRSVNDLQVQLGQKTFESFLDFVESKVSDLDEIEATYLTRAWSARKR